MLQWQQCTHTILKLLVFFVGGVVLRFLCESISFVVLLAALIANDKIKF